jgi:hypothetical protein
VIKILISFVFSWSISIPNLIEKEMIKGAYITWSDLAPGKVSYKAISGGNKFTYTLK